MLLRSPGPHWGNSQRSPDFLAGLLATTSWQRREGDKKREWREEKGSYGRGRDEIGPEKVGLGTPSLKRDYLKAS